MIRGERRKKKGGRKDEDGTRIRERREKREERKEMMITRGERKGKREGQRKREEEKGEMRRRGEEEERRRGGEEERGRGKEEERREDEDDVTYLQSKIQRSCKTLRSWYWRMKCNRRCICIRHSDCMSYRNRDDWRLNNRNLGGGNS